jgi:DNA-binding NarL/FixJ family response regulator
LIVDYSLLDFEGFEDLNAIKKRHPSLTILILTSNITRNEITEFNKLYINNILDKNADKEEFFSCIEAALKGKKYYSSSILDMILETKDRSGTTDEAFHLTSSEIEIVRLIAQGLTTKEIARLKFLSSHTIMTHRKNILRKLGVSNASELIMYAIRNGIIDTIEYHI